MLLVVNETTHFAYRSPLWILMAWCFDTRVSVATLLIMHTFVSSSSWVRFSGPKWHDDVIKWKHSLLYWPFVRGIHRSPVNSLHKGQWRGGLVFSLICVWINGWVNNGEAGDLRCHRAHYDVIVMKWAVASAPPNSDITWPLRHVRSPAILLFVQQIVHADNKINTKAPHYWPFMRGII